MAPVQLDDRRALLPNQMRDAWIVGDDREPRSRSARLVHREDEPALDARLPPPLLLITDLLLGELPIVHAKIAPRRVVHAGRRLDAGTDELTRDGAINALEPVSRRRDTRPLVDLRAVDSSEIELIRLHVKAWRRAHCAREAFRRCDPRGHLGDEDQVPALIGHGLHRPAQQGAPESATAVGRLDGDLAPAHVLVAGLVRLPADDAVSDDRSTLVAGAEERPPLARRLRARARLDRLEGHERILRHALVLERLLEQGGLAQLRGRHLVRVEGLDAISLGIVHDPESVPVRGARTITRDTFGALGSGHHRLEDQYRAARGLFAKDPDRLAETLAEGQLELPIVPGGGVPRHALAGHEAEDEFAEGAVRHADTQVSELRAVGHLPRDHAFPVATVGPTPPTVIPRLGDGGL